MNSKDTEILNYAKYMETVSEKASIILDNKNIPNSRGKSLTAKIGMFDELAPLETVEKHEEPLFKKLREDYEKDPLLTRNGGNYKYCQYQVIPALNVDAHLYEKNVFVVTSDGQELAPSSSILTITFDNSKDLVLEDGIKVRWVKMYSSNAAIALTQAYNFYYQTYSGRNLLYFILYGTSDILSETSSTGNTAYSRMNNVREIVFGYECPNIIIVSTKPLLYTYNTTGAISVASFSTGGGAKSINWLKDAPNNLTLPATGSSSLPVPADLWQKLYDNTAGMSWSSSDGLLKYVEGDLVDLSTNKTILSYSKGLFTRGVPLIRKLILNPDAIVTDGNFLDTTSTDSLLQDIVFYNGIDIQNLSLKGQFNLNRTSILNLFNNLKDRTNEESANIILGPYNLLKVTDEEKAIAINKNWTLS